MVTKEEAVAPNETDPAVQMDVWEPDEDGRFPYTLTFRSANRHSATLADFAEVEKVLADYGLKHAAVTFHGRSRILLEP